MLYTNSFVIICATDSVAARQYTSEAAQWFCILILFHCLLPRKDMLLFAQNWNECVLRSKYVDIA